MELPTLTPKQELKILAQLYEAHGKYYDTPIKGGGRHRVTFNTSNTHRLNFISQTLKKHHISHYSAQYRIDIKYKKNIKALFNLIHSSLYHKQEDAQNFYSTLEKPKPQKKEDKINPWDGILIPARTE